jgi:phospholipid-binding lipoprotein MlaA
MPSPTKDHQKAKSATIILLLLLAGCAAKNGTGQEDNSDPFESVNRGIYRFNDFADTWALRPLAKGYVWIAPSVIRTGFNNFFDNLFYPVDIMNVLLQGKFAATVEGLGRFGMNTTLGFAGILDPATDAGLEKLDEDFGQTLGVWGVPDGPYLMVPFFGPRTVRSGAGSIVDFFASPLFVVEDSKVRWGLFIATSIHNRSTLLKIDQEVRRAFDPYAFVRDSYLQNRQYLLYDGNPPEDDFYLDDEEFDDEEGEE